MVAVGTTTTRTLETAARGGELQPFRGESDLYIREGFDFRVLGSDNQPLVDIKPAEVSLKVNGRAREIRALQLYRSDPAPGGAVA